MAKCNICGRSGCGCGGKRKTCDCGMTLPQFAKSNTLIRQYQLDPKSDTVKDIVKDIKAGVSMRDIRLKIGPPAKPKIKPSKTHVVTPVVVSQDTRERCVYKTLNPWEKCVKCGLVRRYNKDGFCNPQ